MFKPCVVIPVYNHEQAIAAVVQGVLAQKLPCILVDDGSGHECAGVLDALVAAASERIILIRHPVNRGKGSAVLTGARYAAQAGYSHVLQIDADGQHRVADMPRFLEQAAAHREALIVGCPEYDCDGAGAAAMGALSHPSVGVDQYFIAPDQRFDVRLSRLSAAGSS